MGPPKNPIGPAFVDCHFPSRTGHFGVPTFGPNMTKPFQCSRLARSFQLSVDTIGSFGQAALHNPLGSFFVATRACQSMLRRVLEPTKRVSEINIGILSKNIQKIWASKRNQRQCPIAKVNQFLEGRENLQVNFDQPKWAHHGTSPTGL